MYHKTINELNCTQISITENKFLKIWHALIVTPLLNAAESDFTESGVYVHVEMLELGATSPPHTISERTAHFIDKSSTWNRLNQAVMA